MVKETQKIEVEEIKTYKCSDGSVYDSKNAALSHEQYLKDMGDNPLLASKIKELESKILSLEGEVATLKGRMDLRDNLFPHTPAQPIVKYPSQPLPSEPGQVVFGGHPDIVPTYTFYNPTNVELEKMSDEELNKLGYNVTYCGKKRAVIPKIIQFDFDDVAINKKNKK